MKIEAKYSTRSGVADSAPCSTLTDLLHFIRAMVRDLSKGSSVAFTIVRKD